MVIAAWMGLAAGLDGIQCFLKRTYTCSDLRCNIYDTTRLQAITYCPVSIVLSVPKPIVTLHHRQIIPSLLISLSNSASLVLLARSPLSLLTLPYPLPSLTHPLVLSCLRTPPVIPAISTDPPEIAPLLLHTLSLLRTLPFRRNHQRYPNTHSQRKIPSARIS